MLCRYYGLYQPPFERKVLNRAQSRAFSMDGPVGSPWGGPAYGEFNKSFVEDLGNVFRPVTQFFEQAGREIGNAFAAIDREVLQPVGHALESIGQSIANDPLTFVAQVAAVALAPTTGGASLWALPVIQGASVAAHGGSFEDVLKASAISAATVWAGGQISQLALGGMGGATSVGPGFSILGNEISYGTAQAISNAIGYSAAGAIGAAVQGKNADQILSTALASGVGAALPAVIGAIPGFNELVSGASGINETLGKAIQNGIVNTAGAVLSSAITKTDMGQAVAAGLIQSGINSIITTKNIITDTFRDAGSALGLDKMGNAAQSIVANTMTSVFSAALNGGNASNALSKAFMNVGIQSLASINTNQITVVGDKLKSLYNSAQETLSGFTSAKEEFDATAYRRDEMYDDAEEFRGDLLEKVDDFEAKQDEYDAFVQRYDDVYKVANDAYARQNQLLNQINYVDKTKYGQAVQSREQLAQNANIFLEYSVGAAKSNMLIAKDNYDGAYRYYQNALRNNYEPDVQTGIGNLNSAKALYEEYTKQYQDKVDYYNSQVASVSQMDKDIASAKETYDAHLAEYKSTLELYNRNVAEAQQIKSSVTSLNTELTALQKEIQTGDKYYQDYYVKNIKEADLSLQELNNKIGDLLDTYQDQSIDLEKATASLDRKSTRLNSSHRL